LYRDNIFPFFFITKAPVQPYQVTTLYQDNIFPYLETHLVDHCNLNCKGCNHFSPLSSPVFADYNQFCKDINRLSELFKKITLFRLMGGECLLHPEIIKFISFARTKLPTSDIHIVTNGILLTKMSNLFWEALADSKVAIDITVYPNTPVEVDIIKALAKKYVIKLDIIYRTSFFKIPKNLNCDCNIEKSFEICRKKFYCPFLRDGHIYLCAHMAMFNLLETAFNRAPPSKLKSIEAVNIYENISGKEIINYTLKPASCCSFCDWEKCSYFPWDISKREADEWI
jgi:4Fe-4S single cluster domain